MTSNTNTDKTEFQQRQKALSKWENEGGAHPDETHAGVHELTNAELAHLRIRVIALENLMITLLAEGSDQQRELARKMAGYISPREGFTHHPLTIQAAEQMNDMVNRAEHFRTEQSS